MAKAKGVSYYTKGMAVIPVYFPEDMTCCQWCPYVRGEDSLKRHRCLLTWEHLPFPFTSRGNECPITFDEEGEKKHENTECHL